MSKLPKATVKRVREGARAQREGKTDEEWFEHLVKTAGTQARILNTVVKYEGPEGMEFRMQMRGGPGEPWLTLESGKEAAGRDPRYDRCGECGHYRRNHRTIEKHGVCSWHSPWFCACSEFVEIRNGSDDR